MERNRLKTVCLDGLSMAVGCGMVVVVAVVVVVVVD